MIKWVSIKKASKIVGYDKESLRYYCKKGYFESKKLGNKYLVNIIQVKAFFN